MSDLLAQAVIVGLAGWRVAALLSYEDGPYHVFDRIRRRFEPKQFGDPEGFVALLLGCVWCTSVWTTAIMLGLWYLHPLIPAFFAACAVAIWMERQARP